MLDGSDTIVLGVSASFVASLGTAVGSVGIFFVSRLSRRLEDGLLSAAAGVMLAATFFSLLLPSLEAGESLYGTSAVAAALTAGAPVGDSSAVDRNRQVDAAPLREAPIRAPAPIQGAPLGVRNGARSGDELGEIQTSFLNDEELL